MSFTYELEEPGQVSAAIYNQKGVPVRTLLTSEKQEARRHTLNWDGPDCRADDALPASTAGYPAESNVTE